MGMGILGEVAAINGIGKGGQDILDGCTAAAGRECMSGSAMCLVSTGTFHSHTRMLLSSDVDTIRRPSSMKVTVFTEPRCLFRETHGHVAVPIVFLDDFARARVPRDNLLVRSTSNEEMLRDVTGTKLTKKLNKRKGENVC